MVVSRRGPEVDDQLELRRLLDGEISGLRAFEDLGNTRSFRDDGLEHPSAVAAARLHRRILPPRAEHLRPYANVITVST